MCGQQFIRTNKVACIAAPAAACCYFFSSLYTSFIMYSALLVVRERARETIFRPRERDAFTRCCWRDALFETRGVTFFTLRIYMYGVSLSDACARQRWTFEILCVAPTICWLQQRLPTHFHVVYMHFPLFPSTKRIQLIHFFIWNENNVSAFIQIAFCVMKLINYCSLLVLFIFG